MDEETHVITPLRVGVCRSVRCLSKLSSLSKDGSSISVEGSDKEDDVVSLDGETDMQRAPEGCLSISLVNPISDLPPTITAASSSTGIRKPLNPLDLAHLSLKRKRMATPSSSVVKTTSVPNCSVLKSRASLIAGTQTVPPVKSNAEFFGDFCRLDNVLRMRKDMPQILLPTVKIVYSDFSFVDMLSASSAFAFQGI